MLHFGSIITEQISIPNKFGSHTDICSIASDNDFWKGLTDGKSLDQELEGGRVVVSHGRFKVIRSRENGRK
jgi:hypothetical protein